MGKRFVVCVALRGAGGFSYIPLREFGGYEEAETVRRSYQRHNAGVGFIIEDMLESRTRSNFERLTESPEALAQFLAALPVLSGPWNEAFHREYCDRCPAQDCDAEGCPHETDRDNVLWWLKRAEEA